MDAGLAEPAAGETTGDGNIFPKAFQRDMALRAVPGAGIGKVRRRRPLAEVEALVSLGRKGWQRAMLKFPASKA
jgi:hypothetical protein